MTKTVHAICHGANPELLEPLELPEGIEVTVTVELLTTSGQPGPTVLPIRSLGSMKGSLSREDIYGDAH
jgi:hypothetical protein